MAATKAGPKLRAGLTLVPVSPMPKICTRVSVKPMTMPAKEPCPALASVTPKMVSTNTKVSTSSTSSPATALPPTPPRPLEPKPPVISVTCPRPKTAASTPAPATAPTHWATTYAERDGRVDVAAGHVADAVGHADDDQTEGEGGQDVAAAGRCVTADKHGGAAAQNDEHGGADAFRKVLFDVHTVSSLFFHSLCAGRIDPNASIPQNGKFSNIGGRPAQNGAKPAQNGCKDGRFAVL